MDTDRGARLNRIASLILITSVLGGLFLISLFTIGPHVFALQFNPFAVLSGITAFLSFELFVFFISKPARTEERIWLAAYVLSIVIFSTAEMLQRLSVTPSGALFWANVQAAGVLSAPMIYLFVTAYTNRSERRYAGTIAIILVAVPLLTFYFNYTNTIFPHSIAKLAQTSWGWDVEPSPGLGPLCDLLWFDGFIILCLVRLFNFRRHIQSNILRRQTTLIIIGTSIPCVIGTITDILLPSLGVRIPPLALTIESFGAAVFIFATIRYQLLTMSPTLFSNTILGIMQESVVVTDGQLRIIFMNTKAQDLLGISVEDRHATPFLDLVSEADKGSVRQVFAAEKIADNFSLDVVYLASHHKHTRRPVRIISSRLQLGDTHTWVMVLTDITRELHERNLIEHEVRQRTHDLNEARAYLISSINSLSQGFVLVDYKGEIALANKRALSAFEVTDEAIAGKHYSELIASIKLPFNIEKSIRRVLDGHKAKLREADLPDGRSFRFFFTPVLDGNRILGATMVVEDITEQKVIDRSREEFFSIASHELRTPLTAIRGNMSMAQTYLERETASPPLKNLVEDSHAATVRLITLVNDFLDSSKLEQGKMALILKPIDIAPIIDSVCNELSYLRDKRHNSFVFDNLDHLPLAMADEDRFRQILTNLITNANNYTEHGIITIMGEVENHQVAIRIHDTGRGIAPKNQKLLFHKFQQADDSLLARDTAKGTGLGLYISLLLAQAMHGSLELEHSEPGKGSTFVLRLPAAKTK